MRVLQGRVARVLPMQDGILFFQDYINTIDSGLQTALPTMSSSMTDEEFQDLVLGVIRSL